MRNIVNAFGEGSTRVVTNPQAPKDLAISQTLGNQLPRGTLGLREFEATLSQPFADANSRDVMQRAQADVMEHPELLRAMKAALAFVEFIDTDLRASAAMLTGHGMARLHRNQLEENDEEKMTGLCAMQSIYQSLGTIRESLDRVPPETYGDLTAHIFDNIGEFFKDISEVIEKYTLTFSKTLIRRKDVAHVRFKGQKIQFLQAIQDLKIALYECGQKFTRQGTKEGAPYWIKVLNVLAEIQRRCASVMNPAEISEDGSMEVSQLYHPEHGQRKATAAADEKKAEGEKDEPVPHELLNLQPHERLMVITGHTGAGKTTLLRAVAHLHLYNQLGAAVFGADAKLPLVDKILTYQPREDGGGEGMGRFAGECQRLAEMCNQAGPQTVVFIDELLTAMSQLPCVGEMARTIVDSLIAKGARVFMVTHNPHIVKSLSGIDGAKFLASKEGEGAQHQFVEKTDFDGDMTAYTNRAWELFRQSFPELA